MLFSEPIKNQARELGFDLVGIAKAEKLDAERLDDWLQRDFHGNMAWMATRRDLRLDLSTLVPDAKSIIVCAVNYYWPEETESDPAHARISRYGWGADYHDIVRARLKQLLAFIQEQQPCNGRVFVDSAPVMERVWAQKAGLGWQGKNSLLLTREFGSWVFLGEVIVDIELEHDEPFMKNYCGRCTECMQACPTGAIVEPGVVDSRRCLSYLTIEIKPDQEIPAEHAESMGNALFGCDVCQDVCPWNRKTEKPTKETAFAPRPVCQKLPLTEILEMDIETFREQFRKSPLKRPKLGGLQRNALAALQNKDDTDNEI